MKRMAFFFLLMLSINLFSQTKIDSLKNQLKIVNKNEKIDILNELSKLYYEISPQKTIEYGNQALELSQKSYYKKGGIRALRNIGVGNYYLSNYDIALEYYFKSLEISKEIEDKEEASRILNNIGIIYWKLNNFEKALEIYTESLKEMKELENKEGISRAQNNIGLIYMDMKNYDKALEYFIKSLKIMEEVGNKNNLAYCLNNIGIIYWYLENYDKSLEYYLRSYTINKEIDNKYGIAGSLKNIGGIYVKLEEYDKSIIYFEESLKLAKELEGKDLIQNIYMAFTDLFSVKEDYEKALEYFTLYTEFHDSIFTKESNEKIAEMQTKYETEKKEQENEILKKDNEIQRLEINKQMVLRNSLFIGLFLIFILTFVVYGRYKFEKKAHFELEKANNIIQLEKERSDELLLNILPARVADELKKTGKTNPESFENVTVYFSDIVNFTELSSHLKPKYLIDELNDIFTAFDNIMEKNQCERIKTNGDAYLAVCGLPTVNDENAINIINSAIEIIDFLKDHNSKSEIEWKIRIGIHSGRVVGGIVGIKKYIYDVFGDTINTASRMETNSEPMRINVSETTFEITKNDFMYIEREPIKLKGKGMQKMYFLDI